VIYTKDHLVAGLRDTNREPDLRASLTEKNPAATPGFYGAEANQAGWGWASSRALRLS
jgi:hypothetical protein|tara:strand:+ start:9703 stop:9876 length:174 start_codon:yes stop_codon:yes gene_type:complete